MIYRNSDYGIRFAYDNYISDEDTYMPVCFRCPVCGERRPERLYINDLDEYIGCDRCVHEIYEF